MQNEVSRTPAWDVRHSKRTFADAAYQFILDAILSHELQGGASLRAKDLAAIMGISRTPVERALERLSGEGLVEFRPGEGPFVAEPTVAEVLELYDLRLVLERSAVEQGSERVDEAFLARLAELLRQHETAAGAVDGSYESLRLVAQADQAVHRHLMGLWPNRKAQTWYRQLNVQIRSFQVARQSGLRATSASEHRALYEALARRDVAAATAILREHAQRSQAIFLEQARAAGAIAESTSPPAPLLRPVGRQTAGHRHGEGSPQAG